MNCVGECSENAPLVWASGFGVGAAVDLWVVLLVLGVVACSRLATGGFQ